MDKLTINDEASATADGKYSREFHFSNIEPYLNFGFPRTEFLLDASLQVGIPFVRLSICLSVIPPNFFPYSDSKLTQSPPR